MDAESEEVQTAIEVAEEITPITEAEEHKQISIEAAEAIKRVPKSRKKTKKDIAAAEETKPINEMPGNQFAPVKVGEGGGKLFE